MTYGRVIDHLIPSAGARDPLKKVMEYRRHVSECQALARKAPAGEYRNQLLVLADAWESLAAEREAAIKKHQVRSVA